MINDQLKRYAEIKECLDNCNREASRLKGIIEDIKQACLEHAEANGLEKFGAHGVSVTVTEKLRPAYEPDQWPAIMAWCVETKMHGVIQRRLSAAPIIECVENGVPLPVGLTLTPTTDVSLRRTNK